MTEENQLNYHLMMLYTAEYHKPRMFLPDYTCECAELFFFF